MKVGDHVELALDKFGLVAGLRGVITRRKEYEPTWDGPVVWVDFLSIDEPTPMRPHYLRLVSAVDLLGDLA